MWQVKILDSFCSVRITKFPTPDKKNFKLKNPLIGESYWFKLLQKNSEQFNLEKFTFDQEDKSKKQQFFRRFRRINISTSWTFSKTQRSKWFSSYRKTSIETMKKVLACSSKAKFDSKSKKISTNSTCSFMATPQFENQRM